MFLILEALINATFEISKMDNVNYFEVFAQRNNELLIFLSFFARVN